MKKRESQKCEGGGGFVYEKLLCLHFNVYYFIVSNEYIKLLLKCVICSFRCKIYQFFTIINI